MRLDTNGGEHQHVAMRTTVTLDEDVAQRVDQEVRRRGKSVKAVVNDTLRAGLRMAGEAQALPPFRVEAQDLGLRPGIDPDKLNQLVDELEAIESAAKLQQ